MVQEIWILHSRPWFPQNSSWPACLCEEVWWRRFPNSLVVYWWHANCRALSKSFAMKDMGPAKLILGMHIARDRTKKCCGCHKNMLNAKPVGLALPTNNKLIANQCPKTEWIKLRWGRFHMPQLSEAWCMLWCVLGRTLHMLSKPSAVTSGYVMTYARGVSLGNRGCKRLWLCRPQKLIIWLL